MSFYLLTCPGHSYCLCADSSPYVHLFYIFKYIIVWCIHTLTHTSFLPPLALAAASICCHGNSFWCPPPCPSIWAPLLSPHFFPTLLFFTNIQSPETLFAVFCPSSHSFLSLTPPHHTPPTSSLSSRSIGPSILPSFSHFFSSLHVCLHTHQKKQHPLPPKHSSSPFELFMWCHWPS